MIVFKEVQQFDRNTGEELESMKVYSHEICDFTGEVIDEYENPNAYKVDYCDNDPCFGDHTAEKWYD